MALSFPANAIDLPAGTDVEIRLTAATGSRVSHVGDRVNALVIAPVIEDGSVVIPQGALLSGSVVSVHRLGFGIKHCTASIEFRFDSLRLPEQDPIALSARVLAVETAKERVTDKGVIGGIHPIANLSSGFSLFISALLMQPGIAVPVMGVKFLLVRSPDPEIYFPAGTELIVQISKETILPALLPQSNSVAWLSGQDESDARELLNKLPQQQSERAPNRPSDLANVLFLGTAGQIDRAFHAAGWTGAQGHNAMALYRMFHCVVQRAGYSMAPMTHLKLNGVTQQAGYQKSLDTFTKRHHIRLWQQEGSDAWLSAASEDLAFTFNRMLVTHASDRNIDNERAKIVNDLAMTGCVSAAGIVPRHNLHVEAEGRQSIVTDGKVAVLRLNDCTHPINVMSAEHHPISANVGHITAVIARDIMRSNPLALGLNTSNMILNREDSGDGFGQGKTRQQKKLLASDALLSNRWKRPSIATIPVAVAGSYSSAGGR